MSCSLNELGIWIYTHILSPQEITPVALCGRLRHFSPTLICCETKIERQLCTLSREIPSYYHIFNAWKSSNKGKNLEDMNETALLAAKYVSGYYKWRGSLWDHLLLHNVLNFVLSQFSVRMNLSTVLSWGPRMFVFFWTLSSFFLLKIYTAWTNLCGHPPRLVKSSRISSSASTTTTAIYAWIHFEELHV